MKLARTARFSAFLSASIAAVGLQGAFGDATPPTPVDDHFSYWLRFVSLKDGRFQRFAGGLGAELDLRGPPANSGPITASGLVANAIYEIWIYAPSGVDASQRHPDRVGVVKFETGPDGERVTIPHVPLRELVNAHDLDGDDLPDIAEQILGSDPDDPDSDDDGIPDGVEARNFTSTMVPTPGRTGILASVDTPGLAGDVAVTNDLAVLSDGDNGLVLANVYLNLPPEIVGRVDTPGTCLRVASNGAHVAVADGPEGLAVVGIQDPPAARIDHQIDPVLLGGEAVSVAVVADLAYVGLSTGRVAVVALERGDVVEVVTLGTSPVADLFVTGDHVYAVDAARLHVLSLAPGDTQVVGSTPSPVVSSPANRVFAGDGVAWVTHGKGLNTFDVSSPASPTLLHAGNTLQFGWKQVALNGAGLTLAAVGPNASLDGPHDVSVYVSDPAQPHQFVRTFSTPGVARSVTIYNGEVVVADHDRGLHVIGYQPPDRGGVAPVISLRTNGAELTRFEEGQLLRLSAVVQDDASQVRNVEFWVDGVRALTDGAFPFEHFLVTPTRDVRPTITVRARVSDTGGAARWSDDLLITLTGDLTSPQVRRLVPASGSVLGRVGGVALFASEPLAPASVTAATFTLVEAGPDRTLGTPDDVPVSGAASVDPAVQAARLVTPAELAPGRYQASLVGATDRTGNPLPATTWSFFVYGRTGGDDPDGDGLPSELELALGLDPTRADTDNDGVPDGQEDFDSDGVPNAVEVALALDLTRPDSDGDLVPDAQEDQDLDLLADWQEVVRGTSVFDGDTDDDGFGDGEEVARASDPLDPRSTPVRALVAAAAVRNDVDPQVAQGRALVTVSIRSVADPQVKLGRVMVTITTRNDASPEAVGGSAQARPTSVRNQ